MKIIDTHCHPQDSKFDSDRDEIIRRAFNAGVTMVCVGTDLEMSRKAIDLADQHPGIFASVGLHPNDNLDEEYDQEKYLEIAQHKKVVAIGEIGLDYFRTTDEAKKKFQKERFEKQIELAEKLNKPLIIHCRDPIPTNVGVSAHEDMIKILENKKNLRGVIHSFTGNLSQAQKYIELGWYLGFNGIITFAREYDDVLINISVDNVLLETDAPYLTPVPHRGQRNEPSYIIEVAKRLAEIKKVSIDEIVRMTNNNAKRLFTDILY